MQAAWLGAIEREVEARAALVPADGASSVYIGGGTPTALGTAGLARLLDLTARRLAASLPAETKKEARIISWYENQTVNKAFHLGLAQDAGIAGRKIPVTAAQLLVWPDTLLNNHADDAELLVL